MKNRIRRTMMFLNAQRASLVKDVYVYKPDCVILDLEDAVSESEKDSARVQLYHTLKSVDYHSVERWVRINPATTTYYHEDIRAAIAGGCEGIRLPMTETKEEIYDVERLMAEAEKEFGREVGSTMLMAAIESPLGVINAYEICTASPRMMGVALSAGDFTRTMRATRTKTGEELFMARSMLVIAARAAGIMAFDTVHTDLNDFESLEKETRLVKDMGFDGKSIISPRQIATIHKVFTPTQKEIEHALHIVEGVKESAAKGIGVLIVDGQMVDVAHVEGAKRTLELAQAAGVYKGDLI
ncbi:aldolase/citrate lyase family protein [Erysipelothrix rhusiopathiae]|uniref:Citrate (Pro-3S)-lyase, beta subunit n=1 Tax=Erysipelothrix rhusiopathiae ATCC 19414 TaxID=525280 RepID=E7FUN6_ERYRH|nr:aldolase/citrate lyase family protein [Erysipelothrix rhusiopathiae]EFY09497.1 putative citrate (pro-3S)-lyase, beta subunit [Erysipelothrix rhusiopathiae ATCC 19414]MDE8256849.1 aldolase/citrate lyase family protein [Erysipelothrix rhusiopathiae]URQ77974.1 aldolase/citrate lyase family protein [Erysipelothrix rhusiopathiae]VEH84315.1 Citrate lyase subunit beta [Erysipelothrix rhusiopathiae]